MKTDETIYRPRFGDFTKRIPELLLLSLAFIGMHSIDTGPQIEFVQYITAYGTLLWPLIVLYAILSNVPKYNRVTLDDSSITVNILGIFRKTLHAKDMKTVCAGKIQGVDIVGILLKSPPGFLQFGRRLRRRFIGWDDIVLNMYAADGSQLIYDAPARLGKLRNTEAGQPSPLTGLQQFSTNPLSWFRATRRRRFFGIVIASLIALQIVFAILLAPWQTAAFKKANPEVFEIQTSLERQYPHKQIGVSTQTYHNVDNDADGKQYALAISAYGSDHISLAEARKIEAIVCPILDDFADKYDQVVLHSTAEKRVFLFFIRKNTSGLLACPHIFLAPPEGMGQGSGIIELQGQGGPEPFVAPANPDYIDVKPEEMDDRPIPFDAELECCELQQ